MDFGHLFFKFDGRINRAKFWIAILIFVGIYVVLALIGYLAGQGMAFQAVNSMLSIVIFIMMLAVGIKRLHDRNKSGWYIVLFYVVPGVLTAVSVALTIGSGPSGITATALALAAIAIGVWGLIELGFLRGSIGGNQYGADPIAPEILTPPVHTH